MYNNVCNLITIIILVINMKTRTLEEIKLTGLDNCYLAIYSIVNTINYKNNNTILIKTQYTFVGLNTIGKKRFIGSFIENNDDNRFWLDIFEAFKARGVKDILFMCINNNKALHRCLKASFPNATIVPAVTDITDKFYNYFPDKFSTKIKEEIKSLFLQNDLNDFTNIYTFFKEKYKSNVILNELIIKYLSDIDKLYKYDLFIRDVLFNTYKISLLRKRIIWEANKCGYIDNIDDLLNLLLNDLNNLENFTSYHKKEWLNILSSFYTIKNQELENLI